MAYLIGRCYMSKSPYLSLKTPLLHTRSYTHDSHNFVNCSICSGIKNAFANDIKWWYLTSRDKVQAQPKYIQESLVGFQCTTSNLEHLPRTFSSFGLSYVSIDFPLYDLSFQKYAWDFLLEEPISIYNISIVSWKCKE